MLRILFCLLLAPLLIMACDDTVLQDSSPDSQLVFEGWIEDGGFPVVILTRSLPLSRDYQSKSKIADNLVRWAKVTVSDGTDSVVLTGRYDNGYFPPYVYTTSSMRGQSGKTYSVKAEYKDYVATARTTIPQLPPDFQLQVRQSEQVDTQYQVMATFTDDITTKNYYQFLTCEGAVSKQFLLSHLGSVDDAVLSGTTTMPVYKGRRFDKGVYIPYFMAGDTVEVKFAQVDSISFRILDSFTKLLMLSGNVFVSSSTDMESNVEGGYGYWCGMGARTKSVIIE